MDTHNPSEMLRTTVYIPRDVVGRVRIVARARGVTSAAVIRAALESAVGDHRPPPRDGFLSARAGGPL